MKTTTVLLTAVALSACTSLEKQQSNEKAQVEIIRVQREALAREAQSQSDAQIALYQSLAQIAANSPESADAAVLAMALVGQGASDSGVPQGLVPLQEQRNEAIELTKALAPTVGGVITNVGMAALNASVSKASIRQQGAVQINDSNNDAAIVQSVSNLGVAAVGAVGDTITVTDDGLINMGSWTQDSYNTTETTTQTSTQTTTSTSTDITDSYNTTDNSVTNTDDNSVVTYGGQEWTIRDLVEYLASTGEPYSIQIGEDTYTNEPAEGENCVPTFDGYVCS